MSRKNTTATGESNFTDKLPDNAVKTGRDDTNNRDSRHVESKPVRSSDTNTLQDCITAWESANNFTTIRREYGI